MKNKTLIIFSEISWNFLIQRHHFLANYFSEKYKKVIFVERVISRIPSLNETFRILFNSERENSTNERNPKIKYLRSLFLPNNNIFFEIWNIVYWNLFWKKLQFDADIYTFSDNPYVAGGTKKNLPSSNKLVFDIIHNWWNFPWDQNTHTKNLSKIIEMSDYVLSDSLGTYNLVNHSCKKLIPPGVSSHWFEKYDEVHENEKIQLIFFGNLRGNSDLKLLKELANHEGIELSIYGRIDQSVNDQVFEKCFRGSVNNALLPEIISKYHGIVIGYNEAEFSKSISPAKFYESMATGKPIFSRSDLLHLPEWKKFVYKISLEESLLNQITKSLSVHNQRKEEQVEVAKTHLWENRFRMIEELLNE